MGEHIESRSLEAEIADCCQAIYRATEPGIALRHWARLRTLAAQKTEAEVDQFLRETHRTGTAPADLDA